MKHIACIAGGVSLLIASHAWAADTGQLPCKTTQECNENAAKIGANAPRDAQPSTSKSDAAEDQFYWLNKINKASTVMLVEEGIFPKKTGQLIAAGVDYTIRQAREPDGKRPSDVLQIEKIMTDKVGEEASVIHAGRSRQDMYATFRAAKLRNQTLDFAEALLGLRAKLLAKAADNLDALMPGYTNGVQAVPITYGHYLLAYEESFERDQQRVSEAYRRLNLSPMGVGVMSGSIWPLNRTRLAELLGFDGVVENSMDANQVIPFDNQLEATAIANSAAIRIGAMMQDLHTQYAEIRPWLLLQEGSTYTSSSMPQKRNPGLIMQARIAASDVVGLSMAVSIRAHNVMSGMVDSKSQSEDIGLFPRAVNMVTAADRVLDAIVVNKARGGAGERLDLDHEPRRAAVAGAPDPVPRRPWLCIANGQLCTAAGSHAQDHPLQRSDRPLRQDACQIQHAGETLPDERGRIQGSDVTGMDRGAYQGRRRSPAGGDCTHAQGGPAAPRCGQALACRPARQAREGR